MSTRSASSRPMRVWALGALAATALVVTSCSAGTSDAKAAFEAAAAETTKAPVTTIAPAATEAATTTIAEEPVGDQDLPGGLETVGDKSVVLDGFLGVEVPEGWEITQAKVPLKSKSEDEEEGSDDDAIEVALVVQPADDPEAASFRLFHYTHSDNVPGLDPFASGVAGNFAQDVTVSEPKSAHINGQDAALYQLSAGDGADGTLIVFSSGGEYFFAATMVNDSSYAKDGKWIIPSMSFEPEALHS